MSSDQVTKGYFSYRSSTQTCVPHTRKFHLHEHHFFISWIWTPSSFHSHSNCSLHQFPLETKFDISKSEKELSIGSSTAPDINGRGRQAWGPEGWIYINGKISLNFWLPSTLPLVFFFFFFFKLKVLIVPYSNLFPNDNTVDRKAVSKAIPLSWFIAVWAAIPTFRRTSVLSISVCSAHGQRLSLKLDTGSSHLKVCNPWASLSNLVLPKLSENTKQLVIELYRFVSVLNIHNPHLGF